MNIQQMSVSYLAEQDRILTRIMTGDQQELQLLFTRKLMLGLWPLLGQSVAQVTAQHAALTASALPGHVAATDPVAREAMADFTRAASLEKADFQTPYNTQAKWRPLGAEPLLVTEVRVTPKPDGQLALHWIERLQERQQPRAFDMVIDQPLIHGLMQLLQQALAASDWLAAAPALATNGTNSPQLMAGNERPKYLN